MIDCKQIIECGKCKADCCGPVPLLIKVWEKLKNKAQVPIVRLIKIEDDYIIPETKTLNCPFLSISFRCVIYKFRPDVCRKFGDASHPLLVCPYSK